MIKAGTAEKIRNWNNTVLETANNELSNVSSAAIPAVLLTIEAVLIILTTVILILFLHYRNAPQIKATSPYLSLIVCQEAFSAIAEAHTESCKALVYGFGFKEMLY